MISRSEYGPRCTHCTRINPTIVLEPDASNVVVCIFCEKSFQFWIEKLPFYCTGDDRPLGCDCNVCTGKKPVPGAEQAPE
jgi:hypothetical protein